MNMSTVNYFVLSYVSSFREHLVLKIRDHLFSISESHTCINHCSRVDKDVELREKMNMSVFVFHETLGREFSDREIFTDLLY